MNNYEMGLDATETALNSQGSAMKENEKYMQSLQAQINQLKVAWSEMALSVGDNVLVDTLIVSIGALKGLMSAMKALADSSMLLPVIFGIVGAGIAGMHGATRSFATSLIPTMERMRAFGATIITSVAHPANTASLALDRLRTASSTAIGKIGGFAKSLGSFALFTAGVMALGYALEFVIGKIAESNRIRREAEENQKKQIENYTNEKEKITSLVKEYQALSEAQKDGQNFDLEKEERYVKLQNELGNLMPSLVEGIDKKGNSLLANTEQINNQIESLERLIQLEEQKNRLNAPKEIAESYKEIAKIQKDAIEYDKVIKAYQKDRDALVEGDGSSSEILAVEQKIAEFQAKKEQSYFKINEITHTIAEKSKVWMANMELPEKLETEVASVVGQLDLAGKKQGEIEGIMLQVVGAVEAYNSAFKDGGSEQRLDAERKRLENLFEKYGLGKTAVDDLISALHSQDSTTEEVNNELRRQTMLLGDSASAMDTHTMMMEEGLSIAERYSMTTKDQVDAGYQLIGMYQMLSSEEANSTSNKEELNSVIEQLAKAYPRLVKGTEVNIEAIKQETRAREILLQATEDLLSGKLTAEEAMTVTTAVHTKKRIEILNANLKHMKEVVDNFNRISSDMSKFTSDIDMAHQEKLAMKAREKIAKIDRNIDIQIPDYMSQIDKIASIIDFKDRDADTTKKNSDELKNSTYISDQYKKKIEELNLELEKLNAIKSKYPKHSKKYQDALKKELEILKEKSKVMATEAKSLDKQIKSGKIIEKGKVITTEVGSSSYTTSSYATGNSNADIIWNFFKSKGFTDSIVAGIMGNLKLESGLNPNALNKSSGAFGIAQWLGSRKTALQSYASSVGTGMNDINTQLSFLWKELNSTEKRTLNYLQSNQNASASAIAAAFDRLFERSEGTHIPQRQRYANDYYSQYAGKVVTTSSSSSANKAQSEASQRKAEQAQSLDQAMSELNQLKSQMSSLATEIENLRHEIIMTYVYQYEEQIRIQDVISERLEKSTYHMLTGSKQYRDELQKQRSVLLEKQRLIAEEEKQIRHLMKTTQMTETTRAELQAKLNELYTARYDNAQARDELSMRIIQSIMEEYAKSIEKVNYQLEKNRALQQSVNEGSKRHAELLKEEVELIEDKREAILQEVNALEKSLYYHALTAEQQAEVRETIDNLMLEYYGYGNEIKSKRESIVDDAIDVLKKGYETERDLRLNAIDQEIKDLETAHKKKMDMYDEDIQKYEEIINKKLRLIDDQVSEDSFNKELSKMQKEEAEIRRKISILDLDNSNEAKVRKMELEQQLLSVQEQIEEHKLNRSVELRKQNLQDELDTYKESVEEKKEAEQEKFDAEKEALEEQRKAIEYHYNEILKNETFWNNLRQDLLEGNIKKMDGKLKEFLERFKGYNEETIKSLGMSWAELQNMINDITSSIGDVSGIPSMPDGGSTTPDENVEEKISAWNKYLSNKRKYDRTDDYAEKQRLAKENEKLRKQYSFMDGHWSVLEKVDADKVLKYDPILEQKIKDWYTYLQNKKEYPKAEYARKQELILENDRIRRKWGFPDGELSKLENLDMFHDGGIVGGKSSSRLAKIMNQFANLKPNEQIVKALQGELYIPEKNLPNFVNNISSVFAGMGGKSKSSEQPIINQITLKIENLNATKKDADNFVDSAVKKLKDKGLIL